MFSWVFLRLGAFLPTVLSRYRYRLPPRYRSGEIPSSCLPPSMTPSPFEEIEGQPSCDEFEGFAEGHRVRLGFRRAGSPPACMALRISVSKSPGPCAIAALALSRASLLEAPRFTRADSKSRATPSASPETNGVTWPTLDAGEREAWARRA